MNNNLADVTLIVDRSGSMERCKNDAQGGINAFIADQKTKEGECNFTFIEFDTEYDIIHNCRPIRDVPTDYVLKPRGWTRLRDTVGRAVNEIGARLLATPEPERPGLVVVAIVTDGEDNRSVEFTKEQLKQQIEHQQNVYNWKFTYLGANQNAIVEGTSLGISPGGIADYNIHNTTCTFGALMSNVSRMREGARGPAGPAGVSCGYTETERKSMK
jgi:hypothetical protein